MILSEFILALLYCFPFSRPFYPRVPFPLYILTGRRKKLGVYYGLSLKISPWSIVGRMGLFIIIFVPKLITFLPIAPPESDRSPKRTVVWIDLS